MRIERLLWLAVGDPDQATPVPHAVHVWHRMRILV